jgi:hypothetical protein
MKRYIGLSTVLVVVTVVAVSARQDTEPPPGSVNVQEDVNAVICNNKDEQFTIKGSKEPVQLPVGKYYIKSWSLERTDKNGAIWKLQSKSITNEKSFDVAGNAETRLPIGEPVVPTLTAKKDASEFYFWLRLKGQLGEQIELAKNHSRPDPPKLLIRNKDGSYKESLSFEYG